MESEFLHACTIFPGTNPSIKGPLSFLLKLLLGTSFHTLCVFVRVLLYEVDFYVSPNKTFVRLIRVILSFMTYLVNHRYSQ